MADNTGRLGEASEDLAGRKPTVEISPEKLSHLLHNDGEPEAYTSATQAIETLAIDLPDPDPDPMLASGTTPPQLAHTLRREPAHTPIASAPTAWPGDRTDVATIAMRRVRAPIATEARDYVQTVVAPSLHPRDEVRTAAELPSTRRPQRASSNPLTRHPVVRMAPLSAGDAPHSSASSLAVTVPIPVDALPALTRKAATADGSQPHISVSAEPAAAATSEPALDPELAADIAAAVQPTWVSLLAPVRAGEPTQEVAPADVLHIAAVRDPDAPPPAPREPAATPIGLAPTPRVPTAPPLSLALAASLESSTANDDLDEATLLDAEVLTEPPPAPASPPESPGHLPILPAGTAIITSESPGVALAATRSFELPALTIEPRDVTAGEPSVIIDVEITTAIPTADPPSSSSARWPLDDAPAANHHATAAALADAHFALLVGRMPGPPVAAHPTWATKRITAPRHALLPTIILVAMLAALYAIACAMF